MANELFRPRGYVLALERRQMMVVPDQRLRLQLVNQVVGLPQPPFGVLLVPNPVEPDPADLAMASYSIPFCVAVALARDTSDPDSFGESALADASMRELRKKVKVVSSGGATGDASWLSHDCSPTI